jgi:hypothetical protein
MKTTVTVHKPGHYVFGLRDRTTPGGVTNVGTYVYDGDTRINFSSSRDQDLIRTGAISITYGEPVVAKPVEKPVVKAPEPVKQPVVEEEPVVIEDIEKPAIVQVTKAAPKGK